MKAFRYASLQRAFTGWLLATAALLPVALVLATPPVNTLSLPPAFISRYMPIM